MRRLVQPDPDEVDRVAVHCFGCGQQVGVTSGNVPSTKKVAEMFCEDLCWYQEQLSSLENAARDRFIRAMSERGVNDSELARTFGIHRSRVYQILLASNNDEDYLQAGRRRQLTDAEREDKARAGKIGTTQRWGSK